MKMVYILTGKVHTGKTTQLMQWAASQNKIDGIFQPVIDGKRFIFHIGSRTLKQLETDDAENVTTIGKYNFKNSTFEWSRKILENCIKKEIDWIVIDEIGPLELERKGLEPIVTKIIKERENFSAEVICVVREEIFEKFIEHYKLQFSYILFEGPL